MANSQGADVALRSHFLRIQRQPPPVQEMLLAKLSCGLRLPPNEVQALYEAFCQHQHPNGQSVSSLPANDDKP